MIEVISLIMSVIFYIVFAVYFVNKQSNKQRKYIFISLFCILFIPSFFLSLDNMDFFSRSGWFKNSNSDRWFSFFSNYVSALLGSVLSGAILIYITIIQINKTNEFNLIKEKEENRINNLPFIKYNFKIFDMYNATKFYDPICIYDNERIVYLMIVMKNIGMNTVRKCYVSLSSTLISDNYDYKIDEQELIEKNGEKNIVFKIPVNNDNNEINFIFKYQDIMFNWYEQKVLLKIRKVEFDEYEYNFTGNVVKEVYDEKYIGDGIKLDVRGE